MRGPLQTIILKRGGGLQSWKRASHCLDRNQPGSHLLSCEKEQKKYYLFNSCDLTSISLEKKTVLSKSFRAPVELSYLDQFIHDERVSAAEIE
jgi:hypothetical protein